MSLVSEQLPNLMNGVSQQALSMRLPSQAERQINGDSSVVDGQGKRLPLQYLTKIVDGAAGDASIHTINRDTQERYTVIFTDGQVRVFDLDGTERAVTYPDGTSYITTATPSSDIRAITLADTTFVVNTSTVVAKDAAVSASAPGEGQVFIRQVAYDTTYRVMIDGVQRGVYTTADAYGTNPKVSVSEVVTALRNQLVSNLGAGWTITAYSPIVHIQQDNGADFDLEITDSNGNTYTRAIYGKVQRFTDLPVVGKHDYTVKVVGDDGESVDDYYLRFEANAGSGFDSGVWVETVAPGVQTSLDAATMPHLLVRQPDNSFELQQADWGGREAGDETTSPWPSFVGRTINELFYDRNRMCFLSDNNVVMSRARNFFSFFRETVTTLLDSDPIDVTAAGSKVAVLRHAVPFNDNIMLFSDQAQFRISDVALVASQPPSVKEITAYESDTTAAPVAVGKTVFFPVKSGDYTRIMEYFVIPDTDSYDAADITKHVPKYVPKGVYKMAASTVEDVVLALSSDFPDRVYVYRYYWQGSQKVQSSWSYWQLPEGCSSLNVDFVAGSAVFVNQYADGVYLEKIDMAPGALEDGQDFAVRLDRLALDTETTAVYSPTEDTTTITLPYLSSDQSRVVVRKGTIQPPFTAYQNIEVIARAGDTVTVVGDITGTTYYVGEAYVHTYEFSRPTLKLPSQQGGMATVVAGRLNINRWHVVFRATGYFRAEVSPREGQTYTYVYTGKVLGTSSARIGAFDLQEGEFSFRVNADAKNAKVALINDSHLPSYFTAAEWEGRFERRTSRP